LDVVHRPNLIKTRRFGNRFPYTKRRVIIKSGRWIMSRKLVIVTKHHLYQFISTSMFSSRIKF